MATKIAYAIKKKKGFTTHIFLIIVLGYIRFLSMAITKKKKKEKKPRK